MPTEQEAFHERENAKAAALYNAFSETASNAKATGFCMIMIVGTLIADLCEMPESKGLDNVLHALRLAALEAQRARAAGELVQ